MGGSGKKVQIDEALIRKRKYHRGRGKEQIWIFGAVEEDAPGYSRLFIQIVPDRSMATLIPLIIANTLPGSIIVSDEWCAYEYLAIMSEYKHITVKHSRNFSCQHQLH